MEIEQQAYFRIQSAKPMVYRYKASVVICTYNRSELLDSCVASISQLDFPKEKFEVIVVDNNSTDDTASICQQIPVKFPHLNFQYIQETAQGVGYARTRGAREAGGEIVAYIDDDCLATPDWLYQIISFYDQHPEATSTGGRIIPKYRAPVAKWFGKYFWGLVGNYDLGKKVFRMTGVRYPSGANMHFRKSAFDKYGYFEGSLGRSGNNLLAGEEKAMYLKLIRGDEKVYYLPHVIVYHHVDGNKFDEHYVKRHSMGIGSSERIMNRASFPKLLLKLLEYIAKLGYAILYGCLYLIRGQPSKMSMLIKFRWWVIKGFLQTQSDKK